MKLPRFLAAAFLAVAIALVAAGCAGVANPEGWASPAVSEPSAYIVLKKDKLYAVDLQDGSLGATRWVFPDKNRHPDQDKLDLRAIYSTPVVEGDTIYVADYEAGVFAISADDGSVRWRVRGDDISGNVGHDLGVSGDFLAFGTTDGHVYVIKKQDGSPAPGWDTKGRTFDDGIWATPVIAGDRVFVATMGGALHALSLSDGAELWSQPFEVDGAIAALTLLDEERLFVPSLNKYVYIVATSDGSVLGEFKASDWVWTEPAVKGERVYFGDFSGNVYALDITNGIEPVWEFAAGQKVKSGPAIVENVRDLGDVLVVADNDPVVYFLNAETGERLNAVPIEDAGRVRAGLTAFEGRAYVVTTGGKVFAAEPERLAVVGPIAVGGAQ
ncbi:MAG: PQQ-binding-like beta-propeller repeat protein [Dehalococcoidia bacterium]|nr:PQQ-binding-like beta-propeller repeat protein [Dehalococcoidia bacterium]